MTEDGALRLGSGRHDVLLPVPAETVTTAHELTTADGAMVTGVLRVPPGSRCVVTLMHPRQDVTHHALVPHLLAGGYAVWTQGSRSPNNDLSLVHEQALVDFAAGQVFLRDNGFRHVVALGHSGGGALTAFYCEQAAAAPADRLTCAPSGKPVDLAATTMPVPDGVVFLAPHPGQGVLLSRLVDPSVTDEADPLSVDPDLDAFDPRNGFRPAPEASTYDAEFLGRYRAAQAERIARIDARALDLVAGARAANRRYKAGQDPLDRRAAIAPRIVTVYRTDADPRTVDLSLDANRRPYGSLFGRRPDLTNYGLVGFGRLSTADAWLSTWSANHSNAGFLRCAPAVRVPTLLLGFSGDQASFPSDLSAMEAALGAQDLEAGSVDGTHFGGPIAPGHPSGSVLAAGAILRWLAERFPARG